MDGCGWVMKYRENIKLFIGRDITNTLNDKSKKLICYIN